MGQIEIDATFPSPAEIAVQIFTAFSKWVKENQYPADDLPDQFKDLDELNLKTYLFLGQLVHDWFQEVFTTGVNAGMLAENMVSNDPETRMN